MDDMNSVPRVLMACPTASAKEYSLLQYLNAYDSMDYSHKDLFMVDNTDDDGEYAAHLGEMGVEAIHIDHTGELYTDIDTSWQHILHRAQELEYDYIFSLEVDIIGPPDALSLLLKVAQVNGACMVRHAYPHRGGQGYLCSLGCIMMEANLIKPIWGDVEARMDHLHQVPMHEERRFMHVAMASGKPVLDVYNFLELTHLSENGPIEALIRHGHGIKLEGIPAPEW
jgi:hypothetical protein